MESIWILKLRVKRQQSEGESYEISGLACRTWEIQTVLHSASFKELVMHFIIERNYSFEIILRLIPLMFKCRGSNRFITSWFIVDASKTQLTTTALEIWLIDVFTFRPSLLLVSLSNKNRIKSIQNMISRVSRGHFIH